MGALPVAVNRGAVNEAEEDDYKDASKNEDIRKEESDDYQMKDKDNKKDQQTSSSSSSSSPVLTRGGFLVQPRATLVLAWEYAIEYPTCYDAKRGR